jgi:heme/copper-type cytochrome/quinol oxidase subunit 3
MSSPAATLAPPRDPATATGIPNKKLLLWALLASDCMFFGTLISTHLVYRQYPPPDNPLPTQVFDIELTSFSTFVLLMSSLMMALAVNAIQRGQVRTMRGSLLTTAGFGLIFLGCQAWEFWHFVYVKNLTITSSIFGSTFFTLTGTHGAHVAVGVLWLLSMVAYSFKRGFDQRHAVDVEMMGLYWHFVDIVWIVIFTAVYLLEYVYPGAAAAR